MGPFLCYEPVSRCSDLVPAPAEVMQWPYWELGEMEGMLCFSCMGARVDIFIAFGVDPRNADEPVRTDAIYAIESFHIGPVECALRADAVGATGGGQLAWVVAAGSAPTNCSTLCLAGSHYFGNVPGGAFWEEEVLHRGDDNYKAARMSSPSATSPRRWCMRASQTTRPSPSGWRHGFPTRRSSSRRASRS